MNHKNARTSVDLRFNRFIYFLIYSKQHQTTRQWRIYMENNMNNKELKWIDRKKLEEAKEHHLDEGALIPHDVAPCGVCRPWIFFINGVLCFLKLNGCGMEKEERLLETPLQEKMSQEKAHHHRRPWIRAWVMCHHFLLFSKPFLHHFNYWLVLIVN